MSLRHAKVNETGFMGNSRGRKVSRLEEGI